MQGLAWMDQPSGTSAGQACRQTASIPCLGHTGNSFITPTPAQAGEEFGAQLSWPSGAKTLGQGSPLCCWERSSAGKVGWAVPDDSRGSCCLSLTLFDDTTTTSSTTTTMTMVVLLWPEESLQTQADLHVSQITVCLKVTLNPCVSCHCLPNARSRDMHLHTQIVRHKPRAPCMQCEHSII